MAARDPVVGRRGLSMTGLRVLFVPLYPMHWASSRYRAYYWAEALAGHGVQPVVLPPAVGAARVRYYVRLFAGAASADVVFIQKKLLPAAVIGALARVNPRLVFDFDDALFARPTDVRDVPTAAAGAQSRRLHRTLRSAALVVAGNRFLADYAQRFSRRVAVVPTAVDLERLPARPRRAPSTSVTIGWTGRSATLGYLDLIAPAIEALHRRLPGLFRLRVVADGLDRAPVRLGDVPVESVVWTAQTEYTVIDGFDIGIMPLADDDWSRGKCGFKLLQCMARGVPVVASAVGANPEIVQDGVNGLLATDSAAWTERLATLVADPMLRERLGRAGIDTVRSRFSFDVVIPRLAGLLGEVAAARARKGHRGPAHRPIAR